MKRSMLSPSSPPSFAADQRRSRHRRRGAPDLAALEAIAAVGARRAGADSGDVGAALGFGDEIAARRAPEASPGRRRAFCSSLPAARMAPNGVHWTASR